MTLGLLDRFEVFDVVFMFEDVKPVVVFCGVVVLGELGTRVLLEMFGSFELLWFEILGVFGVGVV